MTTYFVSELKRTQQTAATVNKFHNVKIEIDSRLNDGRSGYEGKHYTEYDAALDATDDRWNARFNDGESIEDIKARVADFINDLRTKDYDSVLNRNFAVDCFCVRRSITKPLE